MLNNVTCAFNLKLYNVIISLFTKMFSDLKQLLNVIHSHITSFKMIFYFVKNYIDYQSNYSLFN